MKKIIYQVSGMTCGGCVNRVKNSLANFSEQVTVTLDPPQAELTNPSLDLINLNQALSKIGHYVLSEPTNNKIESQESSIGPQQSYKVWLVSYKPLLLIFGYIVLVCGLIEWAHGDFTMHHFMPNFMAGFFLVFSFFKLLDIKGFASSYAMYDLLAKKVPIYAFVYPLIELALGVAYLINGHSQLLNFMTFIVMAFSSLGVILAVSNRQKIRCACLGAIFNLPMSTVTIIEDLLMAAMALWMVLI